MEIGAGPDAGSAAQTPSGTSSFFVAFRVLPPERRSALSAVYGFCRRADDAVDDAPNAAEAGRRLEVVADELERTLAGDADPALVPLRAAIQRFDLPREPFDDLIDGCSWDIECRTYDDTEALREYCYRVASTVGLLCVRIFGCSGTSCDRYARELGVALQWTNILRDIGADHDRGRVYLPRDALATHGLDGVPLDTLDTDGRRRLDELIHEQCDYARSCFSLAASLRPESELPRLLAAEIMGAVYFDLLRRVERAGVGVLDRRVRVPNGRRAWIALRLLAARTIGGEARGVR